MASEESSAHAVYKEKVIETGPDGTMLTMKAATPVRLIKNKFYHEIAALEAEGADVETLRNHLGRGRSRKGMFEGDMDEGELEIGQIAGAINSVKAAGAIVEDIIAEYRLLKQGLQSGGKF